jgi:hypothetical protein
MGGVCSAQEDVDVAQSSKVNLKSRLREESPRIVRHLADGCPTCNAGLQLFHRTDAALAVAVREQFERELAAGLATAESPVQALHCALADLAVRRPELQRKLG